MLGYFLYKMYFYFLNCILITLFLSLPVKAHHNPTFGFAGTAGPILTSPASTIQKGHFGVGIRTEYVNFNEFSTDQLKYFAKKRQFIHGSEFFMYPALVAAYGITDNFNFGFRYPYSVQAGIRDGLLNEAGKPYIVNRGTSHGVGDLTLFAQYRFLNIKEKDFEAALIAGLNIPAGLAHTIDNVGERFGADHQPGKRSFDPIVGLALTKRFGHKLSFDTNYLFTKAVKGIQKYYSGDLHNYNISVSYRILEPHDHLNHNHLNNHHHVHKHEYGPGEEYKYVHEHKHEHKWYSIFGIDGVIELNGEWRQKQEFGTLQPFGFKDEDSGGSAVYLSPGIRLAIGEKIATYFSLGLPVISDPSGDSQKPDFRMVFGLSRSF